MSYNDIFESKENDINEIEVLKKDLNSLQELVVDQIVEDLVYKFKNKDFDSFQKNIKKAEKFKKWVIITKFKSCFENNMNSLNSKQKEIINNLN